MCGSNGRPRLSAALIAFTDVAAAGCVPAEVAGIALTSAQSAAANGERAELPVQTNTTRWAVSAGAVRSPSSAEGPEADVAAASVTFRARSGDQVRPVKDAEVVGEEVRGQPKLGL